MIEPKTFHPGLVAVIAYDGLCTFEFGIAVEVFGLARPEFDFPWYSFEVVAVESKRCRALGGIVVEADGSLERLVDAQTVIIPGWRNKDERPPQKLLDALIAAHRRGARFLTICSGVFVLAAAGLLQGKRATTHWRHVPELKRDYPEISIDEDVLYVDQGNIITSAGSAAGIDACLHLVRRDFGSKIANQVARRLVMAPHRDGGQAQYVSAPIQLRPGRSMGSTIEWLKQNLSTPLSVASMAKKAAMSERTFLRQFKDSTGLAPAQWLQRERLFRAQELLEEGVTSLDDVAENCGFNSSETFRTAFRRVVGTSPAAYRSRFKGQ
ncbi:MAG: transcriptional regulator FtrA [Notoacmeibacter sp.]